MSAEDVVGPTDIEALIEASSLGTAEAKAARESVPREVGTAIALAAKYLGQRNEARAAVARVTALADKAEAHDYPFVNIETLRRAIEARP